MGESKSTLRQTMRQQIEALAPDRRISASLQARSLLERQSGWRNAKSVFFYASLPEELDVWPLVVDSMAAGKIVSLPRFNSASQNYVACRIEVVAADIVTGRFGVREPAAHCPEVPLNQLDLILVPGVAFDTRGNRLGRGKGFYDRLLAEVRGIKCGVAFDEQIVPAVPVEAHDVTLDCIVTPTRWIQCRRPVLE